MEILNAFKDNNKVKPNVYEVIAAVLVVYYSFKKLLLFFFNQVKILYVSFSTYTEQTIGATREHEINSAYLLGAFRQFYRTLITVSYWQIDWRWKLTYSWEICKELTRQIKILNYGENSVI